MNMTAIYQPYIGEKSTADQCTKFVRGELSEDDTHALRLALSSQSWLALLQSKAQNEALVHAAARDTKRATLISECLAPLADNSGTQELAMRQLRLLAAILERTP